MKLKTILIITGYIIISGNDLYSSGFGVSSLTTLLAPLSANTAAISDSGSALYKDVVYLHNNPASQLDNRQVSRVEVE